MSADPSTEIMEGNADPAEAKDARTILKRGQVIQIDGHRFTLAMHCVVEGKATDILSVGLNPEPRPK